MTTIPFFIPIPRTGYMDKKDIYEHLARIYLDASVKKQTKPQVIQPAIFRNLFLISAVCVVALIGILIVSVSRKKSPYNSEVSLVLAPDLLKIKFDFNPAKKDIYAINLNKLDLTRFHKLGFGVRKAHPNDALSIRIEFKNAFNEQAAVYIKNIGDKWQPQVIDLSNFKEINDWSDMSRLAFIVEEWNSTEKQGVIYIDNIRVMR